MDSKPRPAIKIAIAAGFVLLLAVVSAFLIRHFMILASRTANNPATPPDIERVSTPRPEIIASTQQTNDAGLFYRWTATEVKVDSATYALNTEVFPDYLPDSALWLKTEAAAWNANQKAREMMRQARSMQSATWHDDAIEYLNQLRRLVVDQVDAAMYADWQGDHAEAIEMLRDNFHMDKLLQGRPSQSSLRVFQGLGNNALTILRLNVLIAGDRLTDDPANKRDLQISTAHELLNELLDQRDPLQQQAEVAANEGTARAAQIAREGSLVNAQLSCAAMSIACHIFQFKNGRWPVSAEELVPECLPRLIVDPFGDGKQTLGYLLVKGGLQDGGDRPLVYFRYKTQERLFYLAQYPMYGFYDSDGSNLPLDQQKHGGQFRDVVFWRPATLVVQSTTRPVP